MPSPVTVNIDVTERPIDAFARDLGLEWHGDELVLIPAIGIGDRARYRVFPDQIELYHFGKARFVIPIQLHATNPPESEWFLIHVSLGTVKQEKIVDGETIEVQKRLPIGILIYGPGLDIHTLIPPGVETEVASIRFHRAVLDSYFEDWQSLLDPNRNLTCDDLDFRLEEKLRAALDTVDNKMQCHANVLDFLSLLFDKLAAHDKEPAAARLRSNEIDSLFRASMPLRDPLAESAPSVDELASLANMSVTKFKSAFKQMFGSAPIQYRNKIRMEFARDEIVAGRRTPSEVSYLLGYSHPSNFTAAYKKFFGDVPSADRRK